MIKAHEARAEWSAIRMFETPTTCLREFARFHIKASYEIQKRPLGISFRCSLNIAFIVTFTFLKIIYF